MQVSTLSCRDNFGCAPFHCVHQNGVAQSPSEPASAAPASGAAAAPAALATCSVLNAWYPIAKAADSVDVAMPAAVAAFAAACRINPQKYLYTLQMEDSKCKFYASTTHAGITVATSLIVSFCAAMNSKWKNERRNQITQACLLWPTRNERRNAVTLSPCGPTTDFQDLDILIASQAVVHKLL